MKTTLAPHTILNVLSQFLVIPINLAKPIIGSKGMRAIFQKKDKKGQKNVKKAQKRAAYLKNWAKTYKISKYF